MNPPALSQAPSLESAQALARHLRENPSAASESASVLAKNFDLQPDFVDEVLRAVAQPKDSADPRKAGRRLGKAIEQGILQAFDLITSRPPLFIALVNAILFFTIVAQLIPHIQHLHGLTDTAQQELNNHFLATHHWYAWGFGLALGLQMACFYRYAQVRQALYGSIAFWVVAAVSNVAIMYADATDKADPALVARCFVGILALLIFASMYAALGSLFAVLGGYARIRQEEKAEHEMTRQQLLERLFEVQSRLKTCHQKQIREKHFLPESLASAFNKRPYLTAIVGNLILSVVTVLMFHYAGISLNPRAEVSAIEVLCQVSVQMATILFLTSVAYLAGGLRKALAIIVLAELVATPVFMVDLAPFGPASYSILFSKTQILIRVILTVALAGLGALGSVVEQRTLRANRLKESDPAALLAEMVRLEWRLNAGAKNVCVVVVDAAKSAEMKANSDPLVAEYSFREYQKFLATICSENGGNVHSTAGDGAVLAFPTCEKAVTAAKEIQTGISYFNEHVNRMSAKFRLRIGLHMGPVTGDIKEVQFTEVIDISAHVQEAAPVRGILMTKAVAEMLPGEHLIPLKEPVDGWEVFLAYNPTVDA